MRAFVAIAVGIGLWLTPAASRQRAPADALWSIAASDVTPVHVATLPEGVRSQRRLPRLSPARAGTRSFVGAPRQFLPPRRVRSASLADSLRETAIRGRRPRRMSFPYEATAPPAALL